MYKNIIEKYNELFSFFERILEKEKHAYFISVGLFFPILFSIYKFCLGNDYIKSMPFFGDTFLNRVLESSLLVTLPTYILFFYISGRDTRISYFIGKFIQNYGLFFHSFCFFIDGSFISVKMLYLVARVYYFYFCCICIFCL